MCNQSHKMVSKKFFFDFFVIIYFMKKSLNLKFKFKVYIFKFIYLSISVYTMFIQRPSNFVLHTSFGL